MQDIHFILKKYWGFSNFRPLQQEIIEAVLQKNDVLALMPTGGGKSICFQVPAMAMEGICLVISPLIALIKDQVETLQQKGINTLAIYSGMHFTEIKKTLQNAAYGNYKFLYLSPERLQTRLFKEFLPAINPSLIVADEAHCISQWGYDFRPSYLRIAEIKEELPSVPIIALTASATAKVQLDICEKLLFSKNYKKFQQSFERPNLTYSVFNPTSKQTKLLEIINNTLGSALVYCKSRKQTQQIAEMLQMHKHSAGFYHAGLSNKERNKKQEQWIKNKIRIMVCTNAFGMGIDKPDVRVVVHFDVPDCLENYYQEAGRAGRDGKRSYAVLLYNYGETDALQLKAKIKFPAPEEVKKVYTALMNYLQVPAGSGEGISYAFDLADFSRKFSLDKFLSAGVIEMLGRQEVLTYNEPGFNFSTLVFTCSKKDLEDFIKLHPGSDTIIKGLLRSYEGIFDYPATIFENALSHFLKMPKQDAEKHLKALHHYQIVNYSAQPDRQQITLLQNRMYLDDFKIDSQRTETLRKHYMERLEFMIAYIRNTKECRNNFISGYLGSIEKMQPCGICDNCIDAKSKTGLNHKKFRQISGEVLDILLQSPAPVNKLLTLLKPSSEQEIWQVIDYMMAEGLIIKEAGNEILALKQ